MKLQVGDNLELLREYPDNYFDFVVTDPPYGLGKEPDPAAVMAHWAEKGYHEVKSKGFMGKEWDAFVPQPIFWKEVIRALKPGGHVLAFYGTRTYDWGVMAMRFAGFEIRDCLQWVYGSGFPKSHNVGKAVDKIQGNEREVVGKSPWDGRRPNKFGGNKNGDNVYGDYNAQPQVFIDKGTSTYEGYGTALKPAHEPIVLARKPISEKNIALNCLKWGTGGLNIDGCRVGNENLSSEWDRSWNQDGTFSNGKRASEGKISIGRFPANFIHDGSDEVLELFPDTGKSGSGVRRDKAKNGKTFKYSNHFETTGFDDSGSAARYFYCAKASKSERNQGLESKNPHPTVKPLKLMQYLVRLVAPPGDCIGLDPFAGSGSTLVAAEREGIDMVGVEMNEEYARVARKRIEHEAIT